MNGKNTEIYVFYKNYSTTRIFVQKLILKNSNFFTFWNFWFESSVKLGSKLIKFLLCFYVKLNFWTKNESLKQVWYTMKMPLLICVSFIVFRQRKVVPWRPLPTWTRPKKNIYGCYNSWIPLFFFLYIKLDIYFYLLYNNCFSFFIWHCCERRRR